MDKRFRAPIIAVNKETGEQDVLGAVIIALDGELSREQAEESLVQVAMTLLHHVDPELALTAIEDLLVGFQRPSPQVH